MLRQYCLFVNRINYSKHFKILLIFFSCVITFVLMADYSNAKGRGNTAKSIRKAIDRTDNIYSQPMHRSRNSTGIPSHELIPDDDGGTPPDINEPTQPYFPAKIQSELEKNPGKKTFVVGGILACKCNNKILFTNLVCMDCVGEQSEIIIEAATLEATHQDKEHNISQISESSSRNYNILSSNIASNQSSAPISDNSGKTVHVRGYTRKDGTFVQPYVRKPRSR